MSVSQENPKLVVGIDPNLKAWLEFQALSRFAGTRAESLRFELLDADEIHFPGCFDVIFCLGVLYHTTDPIGMLRNLWKSMTPGATLIVDCQGIPDSWGPEANQGPASGGASDEPDEIQPLALIPKRSYAGAGGIWFLPNKKALTIWLERANFRNITVRCAFFSYIILELVSLTIELCFVKIFYADKLSVDEQRATDWADISSLKQSLSSDDPAMTVEGHPAPHRFYVRATRG